MSYIGIEKPSGQSCEGCVYYIGPGNDAYDAWSTGYCRRYAPNPTQAKSWPDSWCGEWKAREKTPPWTFPHEWHAQAIIGGLRESGPTDG